MSAASPPTSNTCRITGLLCEGREHVLYLARPLDGEAESLVVKVPHAARRLPDTEARLREEARLLDLLSHRTIVRARGLAQVDDDIGLVLERVDGPSLRELMGRAPLSPRATAEALAVLADALAHAGETGGPDGAALEAVHGSLTPDDVRLDPAGIPVILGWSRSACRLPPLGRRETGVPIAPSARPPEGVASAAGDVFALATLALELLDGAQPAPLAVPPEALPERRADGLARAEGRGLSQDLSALLERMLSTDPAGRPRVRDVATRARSLAPMERGDGLAALVDVALPAAGPPEALNGPLVRLTPNAATRLRLHIAPWKVGAIIGAAIGITAAAGILWMKWQSARLPERKVTEVVLPEAPPVLPAPAPEPVPEPTPAPPVVEAPPPEPEPEPPAAVPVPAVAISASVAPADQTSAQRVRLDTGRVSFVIRPAGEVGPKGKPMTARIWRGDLDAGPQVFAVRGVDGELQELTVEVRAGSNNVFCYDGRLDRWCGQSASLNNP